MAKKGNVPYPVVSNVPQGFRKTSGASAISSKYDLYTKGSRFDKSNPYMAVLVKRGK